MIKKISYICCGLVTLGTLLVNSGCTEKIDDSNLYTFTGEMMVDHFENNQDIYGSYLTLLGKVHPSKKSKSTMRDLLDARGHYTCFAPTNEAIERYLDSLMHLEHPMVSSTVVEEVPDSVANMIVFNSIIDNGSSEAYATTDFNEGALNTTTMNDRFVNITYGNSADGATQIYVNANSLITEKDIEVENGYIHEINKVLSPSIATVADLIISTENLTFFGELLNLSTWTDSLLAYKDEDYELNNELAGKKRDQSGLSGWNGSYPEHRYFGFTVFVETDSVFKANGINNVHDLKEYLRANAYYDENTSWGDDYDKPNNAINQFVAYHILPERLIWDRLVIFSNEIGFTNSNPNDGRNFRVNVWEYYETIGQHRRSLKITGTRDGKRINRHSEYELTKTYKERSATVDIPGVMILSNNGAFDNNALNGYYYPIQDILLWTEQVPKKVLNERMRYDVCSLLPELMTNNHRRDHNQAWYYPYDYFTSKAGGSGAIPIMSESTDFAYLSNYQNEGFSNTSGGTWTNYQADEFNIRGKYDFVMKLPPVPYTGTYELRYGVNANENRGMAQIYLGTNPTNLPAVGIPIDLRIVGTDPAIGWVSDKDLGTDEEIQNKDKQMRNNDYMKGPAYFYPGEVSGRDCPTSTRKIIFRGQLEAGITYYVRFKSVLESTSTQFFFDYLEIVPKSIYNGEKAEDKW